jgi:hypothetical protein
MSNSSSNSSKNSTTHAMLDNMRPEPYGFKSIFTRHREVPVAAAWKNGVEFSSGASVRQEANLRTPGETQINPVVPAKAGTQCLCTQVAGFPPSRERRRIGMIPRETLTIPRETLIERRPREGGDPVPVKPSRWIPAFAGMTTCSDDHQGNPDDPWGNSDQTRRPANQSRRPREGGDPVPLKPSRWIPAFAGMTTCSDVPSGRTAAREGRVLRS